MKQAVTIKGVVRHPRSGRTLWTGTAATPLRFYQWFYDPEYAHFTVGAEQPGIPEMFCYLRKVPKSFKVAIVQAVRRA